MYMKFLSGFLKGIFRNVEIVGFIMVIGVGKRNVNEVWIIEIFDINKVDVGIWIFFKRKINVFYFLYMWKLWILFFYRKIVF